jgi:hypothetical protein
VYGGRVERSNRKPSLVALGRHLRSTVAMRPASEDTARSFSRQQIFGTAAYIRAAHVHVGLLDPMTD